MGPIPNPDRDDMKYTRLDSDGIEKKLHLRNLPKDYLGLEMPDNGCINVPLLLRTLHRLCHEHHVELIDYATVERISPDNLDVDPPANWVVEGMINGPESSHEVVKGFRVRTDKVAITAGAYVNHVLYPSFGFTLDVNIWEMVSGSCTVLCLLNHDLRS